MSLRSAASRLALLRLFRQHACGLRRDAEQLPRFGVGYPALLVLIEHVPPGTYAVRTPFMRRTRPNGRGVAAMNIELILAACIQRAGAGEIRKLLEAILSSPD